MSNLLFEKTMANIKKEISRQLEIQNEDNAFALAAEFYTNPDILTHEYENIFEKTWQLIGHKAQLQNIGDQIIAQVGRVPIVALRNNDEQLKAFHNVCRHRAGPLATENNNNRVLRCKYHGWTYSLDGELKSAPEMESTPNFDKCQYHLPEVKISLWQGFVFINLSEDALPIEEVFASIKENIKPIDLTQMAFHHSDEYIIDCNWKVYMDNYLEGYHLPHVHPGLSKILDYRNYKTILHKGFSYQHSPIMNNSNNNIYADGDAHYYCIYPNLMLNILPNRLQTNQVLPIGHNKTKVVFNYYYGDLESEKTKTLIKEDLDFSDEIQQEDVDICQRVQTGLNSGSYTSGRLCIKRESGVLHFQNLIRQSLNNS
jgi:choline monooxygenase